MMQQDVLGPYKGLCYGLTLTTIIWLVGLNIGLAI